MEITSKEINPRIELAKMMRDESVQARAKSLIVELVRNTQMLTKKDLAKWRQAWQMAITIENPKRYQLYDIYDDNMADLHLLGAIRNRKLKVIGKPFKIVDKKSGKENPDLTALFKKRWFKRFMMLALDSIFYGHSLIQLGDLITTDEGPAFSEVKLVPRRHVSPEYGTLLKNISDDAKKGIDYRKTFPDWAIEVCEDTEDLGLLNALSTHCIPKRNALAFWDAFAEIFGMPIRIGKTLSRDQKDIDKMAAMLDSMGSAAYGVFPEGTEIEIVESSKGDAFNVYDKRIERANSEMSKAILGVTMTMDNGSSKSQALVHENVTDEIAKADADFLADIFNDKLKPVLNRHGFKLENFRFEWDDSYNYSAAEMLEVEKMLLEYYDIDAKYFIEKHNIPITGVKTQATAAPVDPAQKKKPDLKLSIRLSSLYDPCPDCGSPHIELAKLDDKALEKEANRIAKAIFDGKLKEGDIDPKIVKRVHELLIEAIHKGYGSKLSAFDVDTPDYTMLKNLQDNAYSFSVAKNYQEIKELTGLLVDGERVRSFSEFTQEVIKLHGLYYKSHLQVEYDTAIAGADSARRWTEFQAGKEAMPNTTYTTVGDDRVRPAHKALNGMTVPIDSDYLDIYWTPNGFGCRCIWKQTSTAVTPKSKLVHPEIEPMFRTNLAKNGLVFPAGHPYYEGLPENMKS